MLETLDYTIRIGSTPTFLYFDLYKRYSTIFVPDLLVNPLLLLQKRPALSNRTACSELNTSTACSKE